MYHETGITCAAGVAKFSLSRAIYRIEKYILERDLHFFLLRCAKSGTLKTHVTIYDIIRRSRDVSSKNQAVAKHSTFSLYLGIICEIAVLLLLGCL